MSVDRLEDRIRRRIADDAIGQMALIDPEVLAAVGEVAETNCRLARLLIDRDVGVKDRVNLFVGMAIAAGMDEDP